MPDVTCPACKRVTSPQLGHTNPREDMFGRVRCTWRDTAYHNGRDPKVARQLTRWATAAN